jgi:hypothetical protein
VPQLKQEADQSRECLVENCLQPAQGQRLHLLIVGVGDEDETKLTRRAVQAIQAKPHPKQKNRYTALPAFAEVVVYGPLAGYVSPGQVYDKLQLIKKTIETSEVRDTSTTLSDVVMVYYQGSEVINAEGHFFLTSESEFDKVLQRSAVSCDGLARFFTDTLGAQVLFLDVVRVAAAKAKATEVVRDKVHQWPDDSHVGVFRSAWLNPGAAPDEARLLTAVQSVLPNTGRLGDFAIQVIGTFNRLAEKYPKSLSYQSRLPEDLSELVIGRSP